MTKRKRINRREFVTTTTGAAAAVALGPTVWIKRRQKTLKILQWSHFVPSYDVWFDKYAKDWGTAKGIDVTVDHISLADLGTRANAEVAAQQGHDLFQFLSPPGAFEPQVLDMADVVQEAERQNGPILDLCKRSTYNPVTRKWFGLSDNYVPDPGDYLKSLWTEVLPRDGAVRHADLGPETLQVVPGVGHVVVAQAEPLARDRVVRAALAQVEDRPVLPLGLLDDVRHVEHLWLERARGREELEQVVPLLRRDLGVGPRPEVSEGDVVDCDLHAFRGPPVLGVLVEPPVVRGDEVAPLQDLERLLPALDPDRGTQGNGGRRPRRRGDELAPVDPLVLHHGPILHWLIEKCVRSRNPGPPARGQPREHGLRAADPGAVPRGSPNLAPLKACTAHSTQTVEHW